jgi:hypothetical protein
MKAPAPQGWAESSKDGAQVNGDSCGLKKMKKGAIELLCVYKSYES